MFCDYSTFFFSFAMLCGIVISIKVIKSSLCLVQFSYALLDKSFRFIETFGNNTAETLVLSLEF